MNGGRWRRRRWSSGRTSSIVTCERSHFERTTSVEHCALRATSAAARSPSTIPSLDVDQHERDVGALGRLERAQLRVVLDPLPLLALAAQARRCRPAGTCGPSRSSTVSIESRVVPGTSETIVRSAPISALKSDDLPTFGRPRIATRIASSPTRRPRLAAVLEPRDDLVEQVAGAVAVHARERDRVAEPEPVELERERLLRAGRRSCSRARAPACATLRRISASSSSPGVTPARASTTKQHEVGLGDRRARLLDDRARDRVLARDVDAAGVDRAGSACPPTRRRAPCGRASCRSSRARPPRATRSAG